MINRFVGVGRLVADPQLKYTPNGVAMTKFKIAINRQFTNQQGEKEADFISCIAFRKQAENLANFMKKGSLVGLEGRIQTGSYEGQDGVNNQPSYTRVDEDPFANSKGPIEVSEDDLPFD